ncbi:ExeM/NucH family extracellular endonuclease [Bogoriella caseilytica]|uniref:LTD domain-containing protein n=1 Tax=Bogoriella caseilytica TaxID=56055 RepID=A0A3N2BFC2_9MICO|nr:ExeM/NucH family extracellular endonuclease [Bogoriella caseilytica]ROR73956.1 hypothetical protein EDD31_2351 [Bogoriella caseilytica]
MTTAGHHHRTAGFGRAGRSRTGLAAAALAGALVVPMTALATDDAAAEVAPPGDGTDCVVISEVNSSGGSGGGVFTHRYVELENICDVAVDMSGWSIQRWNASSHQAGETTLLDGHSIPAEGHFLIQGVASNQGDEPLPSPDLETTINFAAASSSIVIAATEDSLAGLAGDVTGDADVVDALGWGSPPVWLGDSRPPGGNHNPDVLTRVDYTGVNGADFAVAPSSPTNSAGQTGGPEPLPPYDGPATLLINEAYSQGGEDGSIYSDRYVELYNYGSEDIDLTAWSIQFTNAAGNYTSSANLDGVVPAEGHFLIAFEGGQGDDEGVSLDDHADFVVGNWFSSLAYSLYLTTSTTQVSVPTGAVDPTEWEDIVDVLGFGDAHLWSGDAPAETLDSLTDVRAFQRVTDWDGPSLNNEADFDLVEEFVATNSAGEELPGGRDGGPGEPEDPIEVSIAEIRGAVSLDPQDAALYGESVSTSGVVTAVYSDADNDSRAHDGFYLQTPGACGAESFSGEYPEVPCAIFVHMGTSWDGAEVDIDDYVEVTAIVSSWRETGASESAQLQLVSASIEQLDGDAQPVVPVTYDGFVAVEDRPYLLGMLIEPAGEWTVTDNYSLLHGNPDSIGGWVGIVDGEEPLRIPNTVYAPASAERAALAQENAERLIWLDHGGRNRWSSFAFDRHMPLPYLNTEQHVRIGAEVDFTAPVILEYRYDSWRFQPTAFLPGNPELEPATFSDTRDENAAPPARAGDLRLAGFNVLNYFPNLGEDEPGCGYHEDRFGDPTTADWCDVRGAYSQQHFETQQARIIETIVAMDADVVALQEMENSAQLNHVDFSRDYAHEVLIEALNEVEGEGTWDFVSVDEFPESEDVIRNGYIYKPAVVEPVDSVILFEGGVEHLGELADLTIEGQTLSEVYSNAREPMAAVFQPVDGDEDDRFITIVNHLKSKGGSGTGDNEEQYGEGAFNGDRTRQAMGMLAFANELEDYYGTDRIYLMGDFNSYELEDPLVVLEDGGYVNLSAQTGQWSYAFSSEVGSLDHVFATEAAASTVVQTDIWSTNAAESIALEYSRYEATGTPGLYDEPGWSQGVWRASDHDPIVADIVVGTQDEPGEEPGEEPTEEPTAPAPGEEPGDDGPGDDDGPGAGDDTGAGPGLPTTGANPAGLVAAAMLFLLAGAGIVAANRRRGTPASM